MRYAGAGAKESNVNRLCRFYLFIIGSLYNAIKIEPVIAQNGREQEEEKVWY